MKCEEFELALTSGEELSAEALAHQQSCESCKAFAAELPGLLSDAALPAMSSAEQAKLNGLADSVIRRYRAEQPRRSGWRQMASLAVAASLGALITSAVFKLGPERGQASRKPDAPAPQLSADQTPFSDGAFEVASAADDSSDDDSLEVSWPSLNEGDVQ
jgi:hypothetical protein